MESYHAGEVVLLSFPFTHGAGARRRHALVVLDTGDDDFVVAQVTSQPVRGPLDVELMDWQRAGLMLPSVVRVNKVATLQKRLVERKLGVLTASDLQKVRKVIRQLWTSI